MSGPLSSDLGLRASGRRHSVCPSRAPSRRSKRTVENNVRADRLGIRCRKATQQTEKPSPEGTLVPQSESVNRRSPGPSTVRRVSLLQEKLTVPLTSAGWTVQVRALLQRQEARYSPSCSQ